MKFRKIIATILILLLALSLVFLLSPFMAGSRSLGVMNIYDRYQDHNGLPENEGIVVNMPYETMDFYPLMVTFNDGTGLSRFLDLPLDLTVEYTFADFPKSKGHSNIYNEAHPLYNAYLGVYYVKGYKSTLSEDTALNVASYDARYLALPAVGMKRSEAVFDVQEKSITKEMLRFSNLEWISYSTQITTNSHRHDSKDFSPGDLQFRKSPKTDIDYPLVEMQGRLYLTYLEEKDINLCIYVLVKDNTTADLIEETIVKQTKIEF